MKTHIKQIFLSTILTLPATIRCVAMEQPNAPDDLQNTINQALSDYFTSQAEYRAQELGIVKKEDPQEELKRMQAALEEAEAEERGQAVASAKKLRLEQKERLQKLARESAETRKLEDMARMQEILDQQNKGITLKLKGEMTDEQLYQQILQPTTLINLDVSGCSGLSTVAQSILDLMFNRVKQYYWCPQGHLANTVLEAQAIGRALAMNNTITTLSLQQRSGDAIAIEVAKALHVNRTLKQLYLYENRKITDAGAIEIAKALRVNRTLKYLRINSNSITDKGAIELGKALGVNTGLVIFELHNNKIGDEGAAGIAEGLETNTTLRHLTLYENAITAEGVEALLAALEVNKNLLKLKLDYKGSHEKWNPKIWAALNKNIPHIAQRVCENTIEGNLNLSNMTMDAGTVELLGKAFFNNRTVTYLELSGCQLGPDLTASIIRHLATNQTLKQLALGENKMGDQGARALGDLLSLNKALTYITVYKNDITEEGIIALYRGLEQNPDSALEEMRIDCNTYENKAVREIARVLTNNKSLKTLNLSGNLGDDAARALAEMIKVNRSIHSIGLGLKESTDGGYNALGEALEVNTTLTSFSVSSEKPINSGAIRMALALRKNASLKCFEVTAKEGNDVVGKQFLVALGKNTTIDNFRLLKTKMSEPVKKDLLALTVRGTRYVNLS